MDTLVIDRGQWLTGTATIISNGSSLRNSRNGLMCCLGFNCLKDGFAPDEFTGHALPGSVTSAHTRSPWLRTPLTPKDAKLMDPCDSYQPLVEDLLAHTNDDIKLHPSRREARIARVFKHYANINVTFVGKYAEATAKARQAANR